MGVPSTLEPRQECGPPSARLILRSPASGGRDHAAPALHFLSGCSVREYGEKTLLNFAPMYGVLRRFECSCCGLLVPILLRALTDNVVALCRKETWKYENTKKPRLGVGWGRCNEWWERMEEEEEVGW